MAGIKIPPVKLKKKGGPGRKSKRGRKPKVKTAEEIKAAAKAAAKKSKKPKTKKRPTPKSNRRAIAKLERQQRADDAESKGLTSQKSERGLNKDAPSSHKYDTSNYNKIEKYDHDRGWQADPSGTVMRALRGDKMDFDPSEVAEEMGFQHKKHGGQIKSSIQQRGWGKARRR